VAKITDDAEALLTFFDFPAEHWLHLKTSNPIESTFSSVRCESVLPRVWQQGPQGWPWRSSFSRRRRTRWRAVNGRIWSPSRAPGERFHKEVMVERPDKAQEVTA
jgi:putative transposase